MNELAIELLNQHIPSIVDEIEDELFSRILNAALMTSDQADTADCALRICHCGERIDGFYEYVDHLKAVLA